MAKAYYGSRISNNRTKTPEGFLICHNVPIARTGWQKYYGQEIGLQDELADREIQVLRSEEEVFHPATLASFEGKTATDEHPNDWVKPENMIMFDKGHAQNIRRGTGDESDLLIADLFITDPNLISIIESGMKKEVSCGYDCIYEQIDETKFQQKQIRGNHIAIVKNGRAGNRVAIKDSSTVATEKQQEGGNKQMAKGKKITKDFLAAIGLKHFIQDAEPEEIVEATKSMNEDAEPDEKKEDPKEDKKTTDEGDDVKGMLAEILSRISALEGKGSEEMSDLDMLEEELGASDADNEESITIPAEEMDSEELTEPGAGYVEPESERPKNPIGDRAAALDTIRSLKPMILAIPDIKERKRAADSLAKLIRSQATTTKQNFDAYASINNGANQAARKAAMDAEANKEKDARAHGRDYAKKHNPHYKEK